MNNNTLAIQKQMTVVFSHLMASLTPEEKTQTEAEAARPERKQCASTYVNPGRDLPRDQMLIARRLQQRTATPTHRRYNVLGEDMKYMPAGPRKNLKPHNR